MDAVGIVIRSLELAALITTATTLPQRPALRLDQVKAQIASLKTEASVVCSNLHIQCIK
jgi:hypothetical protein